MAKRVLLTSFGGKLFNDFHNDFKNYSDMDLFVADMNLNSVAKNFTDNFIHLPPAEDTQYIPVLLEKAKKNHIDMIIPGADEEAFALMKAQDDFRIEGIDVAVQPGEMIDLFNSKSSMFDYLRKQGCIVPPYEVFVSPLDFEKALEMFDYPARSLLIKPNSGRGGRDIFLLSEIYPENKDDLQVVNKTLFLGIMDGITAYLLSDYIDGTVYDVDVMKYKNGDLFWGIRKRYTNITKHFYGNIFEFDENILKFSKTLYEYLPTEYLIDYDLMVTTDGRIELLEINPRPSGSTISYLPFGINLYYLMAKSYLKGEHVIPDINQLYGKSANMFFKMVKIE